MEQNNIKLTVLFDGTFWIGVFERISSNKLAVAKVTFGSEPKDIEIYNYLLYKYQYLKFSNPTVIYLKKQKEIKPKRMKRIVKKQINTSIGTKSMQALKKEQEQNKIERKIISKEKKEEITQMKFEMKQNKKRQKHKGR